MEKMEKLIVVPTYNESMNVEPLIEGIFSSVPDAHILFVDDGSPDGTGELLDERAQKDGRIEVIHRALKGGLAGAYIEGLSRGIEKGYRYLCQMDADLSHPPHVLGKLFDEISDCDFVVASRYVREGGTKDWGISRRFISQCGNLYARAVLLSPIHDLTGGFSCWRKEVLEAIDLRKIRSKGYVFQVEMKYRASRKGFSYREIPFIFDERTRGKSKMSGGIFLEAFTGVIRLRASR